MPANVEGSEPLILEETPALAASLAVAVGEDVFANMLKLSREEVQAVVQGRALEIADPTLIPRLTAWISDEAVSLFHGQPLPPFDHLRGFWSNFTGGPRVSDLPIVPDRAASGKLLDFELRFPFGVPSCALTAHSGYVDYFAKRAYDLITYKTVRDRPWNPHPFPQWGFAVDAPASLTPADFDTPVEATLDPSIMRTAGTALVNSFGVPSLPPDEWKKDIEKARLLLDHGQILIVSVMGTPERAADDSVLATQFADTAEMAAEAGAQIVEVNLSCPNTGGELVCRSPETSRAIVEAVSKRLRPTNTPLFIKISYLDDSELRALMSQCQEFIQGVVGINTVSVPVESRAKRAFFDGRARAGLSGSPIFDLAIQTAQSLVKIRREFRRDTDLVIVGVGGVTSRETYELMKNTGVDAVQSCSGAWVDPDLARKIQGLPVTAVPRTEAVDSWAILRSVAPRTILSIYDLAAVVRLSPSEVIKAVQTAAREGLVNRDGDFVTVTRKGRKALRSGAVAPVHA